MADLLDRPIATMTEGRVVPWHLATVRSANSAPLWLTGFRPRSAPWMTRIEERLAALCALAPGWDDDQALAIDREIAIRVRNFLAVPAMTEIIEPDVVPTQDGGLQIEWHTLDFDIVLAIEPGIEPSGYVHDQLADDEWEGPLSAIGGRLAEVWSRLAA